MNPYDLAWETWNKHNTPDTTQSMLDAFEKDIRTKTSTFAAADIPDFAVEAAVKKAIMNAAKTFNPSMGNSFRTHANNYMMKANRLVYQFQNVGKIPEERIRNITRFKSAEKGLSDALGRKPSSQEMADKLRWDVKEVIRMKSELRKGVVGESAGISKDEFDFATDGATDFIYHSIPDDLKNIFEYTVGYGGHQKLDASEIKRELGLSDSEYRAKREQLRKFLDNSRLSELL